MGFQGKVIRRMFLSGVILMVLHSCNNLAYATNTDSFRLKAGKVFVAAENQMQTSIQARFHTQILHPRLGVSVGKTVGSKNIYLLTISYQLVPNIFDFVVGIAGVESDEKISLKPTFGCNFDIEVFKKIAIETMNAL